MYLAVVPKVVVSPNMVTEMQGSNIKAVCQATGSPPPEIQWKLDMIFTHYKVSWSPLILSLAAASMQH